MGYTHYFTQRKSATTAQWESFTKKANLFLTSLIVSGEMQLQPDVESTHPNFEVNGEFVAFNGDSNFDLDHETFYVSRQKSDPAFSFCKTARKPYDLAVCGCLILIHASMPDVFDISSDGDAEDWSQAQEYLNELFRDVFTLPPKIA